MPEGGQNRRFLPFITKNFARQAKHVSLALYTKMGECNHLQDFSNKFVYNHRKLLKTKKTE
jgi:hypothetical protein